MKYSYIQFSVSIVKTLDIRVFSDRNHQYKTAAFGGWNLIVNIVS